MTPSPPSSPPTAKAQTPATPTTSAIAQQQQQTTRNSVMTSGLPMDDEYDGDDNSGTCDWQKVAFYVSVLSATLIIFWFCTMRGPIIGKPYPQLPELPAQGEGQPTVQPAPGEPYLTYLLLVKQHVLNAIKDGSLENDRHPNMQPDGSELITSVNFLTDAARTITIVACSVALAPAIKSLVFKLLALSCFGGIGLSFLTRLVRHILALVVYFKFASEDGVGMIITARILQIIVVFSLTLTLLMAAVFTLLGYSTEFTTPANGNDSARYEPMAAVTTTYQTQKQPLVTTTAQPWMYGAALPTARSMTAAPAAAGQQPTYSTLAGF